MQNLCGQLRILYNLILNLESIQEALYSAALREREALISYSQNIENSEGFGMTFKDEREGKERRIKFNHFLNSVKAQVKQLSKQYNDLIKKYLGLLATSSNMNLQLLSVRLNFNDYYKITWQEEISKKCIHSSVAISENHVFSNNTSQFYIHYNGDTTTSTTASFCSSKYGSVESLISNSKKKRKCVWCCVG